MVSFAIHNVKGIKADPCGNWVTIDVDNGPMPAEITLFFTDMRMAHAIRLAHGSDE